MKAKLLPVICCLFVFSAFAQIKEARKSAEFGLIPCGYFNALLVSAYEDYKKIPDSNIYVIYYVGKNQEMFVLNEKTNVEEKKLIKPRRGNALNRAKEVSLFLETVYTMPKEKIILIDGGFRENFEIEIWTVPKDAAPPSLSPTINAKEVKFGKGKPSPPRNCAYGDNPTIAY